MTKIDYKQIRLSVLGIFVVIFAILIWFLNTDYFIKRDYLDFKKTEFKATLFSKKDEHPIKGNKIYLKNGPELIVHRELFDKLKVGDSIIKKVNSDSIFFHTSSGIIIDDYNEFKRRKYLKSLK
ncbi:MAG: hypothetical protein KDC52_05305 [Ignavibacteriae bacterium]|nr:hypothetical protein [Ignavibacteriota bacterium]MCB0750871.1 hypothetical protein [Ignavibacteriota bacterium]